MHLLNFEEPKGSHSWFGDCLVVFLGTEPLEVGDIDSAYSNWVEQNVPPPTTLIVGAQRDLEAFAQSNPIQSGRYPGLDRLYGIKSANRVILVGFDHTGTISTIEHPDDPAKDVTALFNAIVASFVQQQCEESDVIIPAPPGTYFDKQSSRLSSHFIRAEALLHSTSCIELLALRLLKPFHDWVMQAGILATTSNVYIDTMAVWPVAEKLRQLLQKNNPEPPEIRIESFRSYDGLSSWSPPNRPAFVIISATTSGGLADRVRGKIRSRKTAIWTLLALESKGDDLAEPKFEVIASVPRQLSGRASLDGLRSQFEVDVIAPPPGTETICIVGERFLSQAAKPKRVRLIHKNFDESVKAMLANIAKQKVIKVHRGGYDSQSHWTISADLGRLIQNACSPTPSGADSLLRSWLKNYSSPSPVAIIYPSPEGAAATEVRDAAREFADRTAAEIRALNPEGKIFTLSSADLESSHAEHPYGLSSCSVIITCPVIGNGFILKQISAALRHKQPKGPRLYLVLSAFPESAAHFTQLAQDIAGAASDVCRYSFKNQYCLPVGRLDSTLQWNEELTLLIELNDQLQSENVMEPWLSKRIQKLEGADLLDDDAVFLPSSSGEPLPLSSGFLLWKGSSEIFGDDYAGAVLLSVAGLLQASRIAKAKEDATSLRTGLFQHALICPESFTRFNDPVIQAALLRAAYASELNYSVCHEMSRDMARLLKKWVRYYQEPAGAALGEFMLAIARGKLRLRETDAFSVLASASACSGWLGNLAKIAANKQGIEIGPNAA